MIHLKHSYASLMITRYLLIYQIKLMSYKQYIIGVNYLKGLIILGYHYYHRTVFTKRLTLRNISAVSNILLPFYHYDDS